MARLFFTHMHPEPFDKETTDWHFPTRGPASGSNQALAYLVFKRDLKTLEEQFPELELVSIRAGTLCEYLASGGVLYKQLLPSFCFPLLRVFDGLLTPFMAMVGLHQLIVVRRKKSDEQRRF